MRTLLAVLYTTRGPVRGPCGHQHRSIATAQACCEHDQREMSRAGLGHLSDRVIERVDGAGLSDAEHAEWAALT